MGKEIKIELERLAAADALLAAALTTYGAMKAVEFMLPAIVRTQLSTLENAIVEYSKLSDVEPMPESMGEAAR